MTNRIKFVRGSLTKVSFPTTFLNKTKKISLNRDNEPETYVLTTKDTPIECVTAEQDFNYFLAKGGREEITIDNCQLGFPFTENYLVNSNFKHTGDISYVIKPGVVIRSALTLWGKFVLVPRISSITYYLPISANSFSATTYSF